MHRATTRLPVVVVFLLFLWAVLHVPAQAQETVLINAIEIRNNVHIETARIRSAITHTRVGTVWVEENVMNDLHAIYELGYFYDVTAKFEPAGTGVKVVFEVDENPVIRDIIFSGSTRVSLRQYKEQMLSQPGQVLNVNILMADIQGLSDWVFSEYGIAVRPVDLQADEWGYVTVEVVETVISEIRVEGNTKTEEFVITRELSFKAGDVLDMNEVNRSLRRVLMLGFFDEINPFFVDGATPDEQILVIEVAERQTGSVTGGVGYGTADGWMIYFELGEENLLGRAQSINVTVEYSTKRQTYELGFYEPYITAAGTSLGVNVYRRATEISEESDRRTIGGDITFGHPLGEFTRGRLTFRAQNNTYTGHEYVDYNTRVVGVGALTNTTDHPFFPTEGFRNNIGFEVGTAFFGGDAVFTKIELDHSRFCEVREGGFVFAVRAYAGRLLTGALGESEKFRIGGDPRMRGYSRGNPDMIGDKALAVNAEFRFPIVDRVQGVVFTDWGRAWPSYESMNVTDLLNSFGLGVRLDTPLGLLRLDYGWGLDEDDRRQGQFTFGIGQTF